MLKLKNNTLDFAKENDILYLKLEKNGTINMLTFLNKFDFFHNKTLLFPLHVTTKIYNKINFFIKFMYNNISIIILEIATLRSALTSSFLTPVSYI